MIDRSGSMSGQPLDAARSCAEFVLDGLQPTDRLSVVAYDSEVRTLVPATTLEDKQSVRRAIRAIDSGGSTDLHGGWFRGAETLAPHATDGTTSRVILLSDGCANHGLVDPDQIYAQCADFARAGVSTSTYGLGDGFNEELMIGMSRHGQGSSYYGRTAEDLMDPFSEEFELLNALCAKRLRRSVEPAPGVKAKVLNDYVTDTEGWALFTGADLDLTDQLTLRGELPIHRKASPPRDIERRAVEPSRGPVERRERVVAPRVKPGREKIERAPRPDTSFRGIDNGKFERKAGQRGGESRRSMEIRRPDRQIKRPGGDMRQRGGGARDSGKSGGSRR